MLENKLQNKSEVIHYINSLEEGYEGYVQFSHRAIERTKDIFIGKQPSIEDESGFIYEAHFSNETESIMIRQQNAFWIVSRTNITNAPRETFHGISDLKINMAQIWESKADPLCEGMQVMQLQKVVFAGFEKGESK